MVPRVPDIKIKVRFIEPMFLEPAANLPEGEFADRPALPALRVLTSERRRVRSRLQPIRKLFRNGARELSRLLVDCADRRER
jgi:hypothetical protein